MTTVYSLDPDQMSLNELMGWDTSPTPSVWGGPMPY